MRRFHFPLERLLWLRRLKEALAQQALARALERERDLRCQLDRTRAQAMEEAARLHASLGTPTPGTALRLHWQYAGALASRQARLVEGQAESARQVAADRQAVQQSWRAREAVARLRALALAEYSRAAVREQQRLLDEVAGVRHAQRTGRLASGATGKEAG